MWSRDPFSADLHRLLCQLSDAEQTPELLRQIEALVMADPNAKRQYLAYMQLESIAEQMLATDRLSSDAAAHNSGRMAAVDDSRASLILFPADDELVGKAVVDSEALVAPSARLAGQSEMRWISVLIGSVAVLVGGILLGVWGADGGLNSPRSGHSKAVATLVGTQNCRWNNDVGRQLIPGARLPAGELQLDEGLAELVFDCGAQVILEGPAEFELTGAKSATAWRGRLVTKVPPAAIGFTIVTPYAKVIDYGTEFALSVEYSKATEIHVIAGKVEVESASNRAKGESAREELRTGQAVRLDRASHGLPRQVELADNRFVRNVRFGNGLYPPSLISYWSFDETLEGVRVLDRAGSNHGSFEGRVHRVGGLVGDGAARFTNSEGDLINVGPEFSFTTGITIEALIACTWDGQYDPAAGADVYPDHGNYDEIFRKEDGLKRILFSFQHDDKDIKTIPTVPPGPVLAFGLNVGSEYSELDMPLDGRDGRPTVAEICDGKMHYVAATYDSATGEKAIYVDGRKRFSTRFPSGTLIESGGKVSAGIGGWYIEWADEETTEAEEPFTGAIDEVAVYRSALSDSEIAEHYRRVLEGRNYYFDAPPDLELSSIESDTTPP